MLNSINFLLELYQLLVNSNYLDTTKNGTKSIVAEAKATHVLLAFHMLFINILILNLLIAVFT